jgi:hypothetical protein
MRRAILVAFIFVPMVACGARTGIDDGASTSCDPTKNDAPTQPVYSGVVRALADQKADTSFTLIARFTPFETLGTAQGCTCLDKLPLPLPHPPSAGTLTLLSGPAEIAMLAPASTGFYDSTGSQAWQQGEGLTIVASGADVHAFCGVIPTGHPLAGIDPPIGDEAVAISRSEDLHVTWTPQSADESNVTLIVGTNGDDVVECRCFASDASGGVVMPHSVLAQLGTASKGTITLERTTTTSASSDNATIALVGDLMVSGPATLSP